MDIPQKIRIWILFRLYTSEIASGWLDVLAPTKGGTDLTNPFAKQALSLARSFVNYQTRPWALIGYSSKVERSSLGNAGKEEPFNDPRQIPSGIPYFKPADVASGILDTIEPRYYVVGTAIPPKLDGYQKVPFFEVDYTSLEQINNKLTESIRSAIRKVGTVKPIDPAIAAVSKDLAVADAFFNLQRAVNDVPYGAVYFDEINHALKYYNYTLQFGSNRVLEDVVAFPVQGFRRLIQQAQLSNGLLRYSNSELKSTVITQGIRSFPFLEDSQIAIPFGSIIGRILYPLGISFLLPIFSLELVRDKEKKILTMLRMVFIY
jgi:hypothetical protein